MYAWPVYKHACVALKSHGNNIIDHGKSWKNHEIVFLNIHWNPENGNIIHLFGKILLFFNWEAVNVRPQIRPTCRKIPELLFVRIYFIRHSDIQMLQKINELDKKLKTMEKEASDRQDLVDQVTSADTEAHAKTDSICDRSKESPHSLPVTRGESSQCQEAPMTPREKKLIAQLSQVGIMEENMGLAEPVFRVSEKVVFEPACSDTETS